MSDNSICNHRIQPLRVLVDIDLSEIYLTFLYIFQPMPQRISNIQHFIIMKINWEQKNKILVKVQGPLTTFIHLLQIQRDFYSQFLQPIFSLAWDLSYIDSHPSNLGFGPGKNSNDIRYKLITINVSPSEVANCTCETIKFS